MLQRADFILMTTAALDIDQIQPARKFKGGWNDLKLPLGHKEMLKSLVQTHLYEKQFKPVNDRENRDFDLVRGKGTLTLV